MADPFVFVRPEVVSCAVRYALGRRSYIVGTIVDQVRSTWNDLGEQQNVIREDVQSWLVSANAEAEVEGGEAEEYDTWLELWRWMQDRPTPAASADTGHTLNHVCSCGHSFDLHMAVQGGCSLCSCKAHPPNQPAPPAASTLEGES